MQIIFFLKTCIKSYFNLDKMLFTSIFQQMLSLRENIIWDSLGFILSSQIFMFNKRLKKRTQQH